MCVMWPRHHVCIDRKKTQCLCHGQSIYHHSLPSKIGHTANFQLIQPCIGKIWAVKLINLVKILYLKGSMGTKIYLCTHFTKTVIKYKRALRLP